MGRDPSEYRLQDDRENLRQQVREQAKDEKQFGARIAQMNTVTLASAKYSEDDEATKANMSREINEMINAGIRNSNQELVENIADLLSNLPKSSANDSERVRMDINGNMTLLRRQVMSDIAASHLRQKRYEKSLCEQKEVFGEAFGKSEETTKKLFQMVSELQTSNEKKLTSSGSTASELQQDTDARHCQLEAASKNLAESVKTLTSDQMKTNENFSIKTQTLYDDFHALLLRTADIEGHRLRVIEIERRLNQLQEDISSISQTMNARHASLSSEVAKYLSTMENHHAITIDKVANISTQLVEQRSTVDQELADMNERVNMQHTVATASPARTTTKELHDDSLFKTATTGSVSATMAVDGLPQTGLTANPPPSIQKATGVQPSESSKPDAGAMLSSLFNPMAQTGKVTAQLQDTPQKPATMIRASAPSLTLQQVYDGPPPFPKAAITFGQPKVSNRLGGPENGSLTADVNVTRQNGSIVNAFHHGTRKPLQNDFDDRLPGPLPSVSAAPFILAASRAVENKSRSGTSGTATGQSTLTTVELNQASKNKLDQAKSLVPRQHQARLAPLNAGNPARIPARMTGKPLLEPWMHAAKKSSEGVDQRCSEAQKAWKKAVEGAGAPVADGAAKQALDEALHPKIASSLPRAVTPPGERHRTMEILTGTPQQRSESHDFGSGSPQKTQKSADAVGSGGLSREDPFRRALPSSAPSRKPTPISAVAIPKPRQGRDRKVGQSSRADGEPTESSTSANMTRAAEKPFLAGSEKGFFGKRWDPESGGSLPGLGN